MSAAVRPVDRIALSGRSARVFHLQYGFHDPRWPIWVLREDDCSGGRLLYERIHHGACCPGKLPGPGFRAVHLENICCDVHGGVLIHTLKLKKWVVGGDLKSRDEFTRCLLPPPAEEIFPRQGRDTIGFSDEFLI
jgi:hypothetical protein